MYPAMPQHPFRRLRTPTMTATRFRPKAKAQRTEPQLVFETRADGQRREPYLFGQRPASDAAD
jgi:hypothetical protein